MQASHNAGSQKDMEKIMTSITRRRLMELGAASAIAAGAPLGRALAERPLNLGFQITTWGAVGMVAEALDSFKKQNVDVAFNKFDSGVAVRDALVAGRVDIGVTSVSTFIVGVDKGNLTGIATVAYSGASNSIMVAKNSKIKTVPDLRGKKVATQFGAGSDYTFRTKVLAKFGLKPEDLQLVNAKYGDHVAALASGSVDAFVGTEPFPAVAEAKGIARPLVTFEAFDLVPVMLAINRPILESRRNDVVAFMKGWLSAVDLMRNQPDRAAHIVAEVFKKKGNDLSEKVIKTALDRLGVDPNFRPALMPYLETQAEVLVKQHRISAVPDWNKALDRSILKDARVKS
jgi:ABC-type nitrate/sulfonate/bicarbonate transport system substrate-binding protein